MALGGAFIFVRKINANDFADSLSLALIIGYVLTNAVYAFTFGQYFCYVIGLGLHGLLDCHHGFVYYAKPAGRSLDSGLGSVPLDALAECALYR